MLHEQAELTVREAVHYTGFTRFYIYILINEQRVQARKINTRASPMYLISRHSLDAYMLTSRKHKKQQSLQSKDSRDGENAEQA